MLTRHTLTAGFFALLVGSLTSCSSAPTGAESKGASQAAQPLAIASNMKLAVGHVDNVTSGWVTVPLASSYTSMVVVATPAYAASSPPLVTRIRNVSTSSFELKVDRFDTSSATFTAVGVDYIVVEAGRYSAATDGITLEAATYNSTVTDRKGSYNGQVRSYLNTYKSPVVLGQVMSYADARPSAFWSRGSSAASAPSAKVLRVGKHVGEDTVVARANEVVGYIVIESGAGTIGSVAWQAALGPETVQGITSGTAASYALTVPGPATRAVLSQSGMNGSDGSWALLSGTQATSGASLLVNVDEDNMRDSERTHSAEQVAYFAINQCPGAAAVGQPCETNGACTAEGTCCHDVDSDGVCDSADACAGADDRVDTDHDGKPDACDTCPLDAHDDSDGDSICDSSDRCAGSDDRLDWDHDGIADGCDAPEPSQCVPGVKGKGVIEGDVALLNALEIPPNLTGAVCITGSLDLWYYGGASLGGLESLTAVGGRVLIAEASSLTRLTELGNLKRIGGSLGLFGNRQLVDLNGLAGLSELGGELTLGSLTSLRQFDALGKLTEIHGHFTLYDLPSLVSLQGASNITRVDGNLGLQSLPISSLTSLASIQNIGALSLSDLPNLANLAGLDRVRAITGDVMLTRLGLTQLSGLQNVAFMGGNLILNDLDSIENLSGLDALASVGNGIQLDGNARLASLSGLGSLTRLREFTARDNPLLRQCEINGLLAALRLSCSACWGNDEVATCQGAGHCLNGSVWLQSPVDIQGLSGVTCINGDVTVASGATLTDLSGLDSLISISGNLSIETTQLTSLHGLEQLATVGGRIWIERNMALTSLAGLSALASASDLRVMGNEALAEAALPALTSVDTWYIGSNLHLPRCWALVLEQRLQKGCSNCAQVNGGEGACPAPVDGWIDQGNYGDYVIIFASGGGAGSFATVADAHATYPNLTLADPVYDGEVYLVSDSRYGVRTYSGNGACCFSSPQEAIASCPSWLLKSPQ